MELYLNSHVLPIQHVWGQLYLLFDIVLTVYIDKLYNETNEMHFLEFYSVNILYMFRIGNFIALAVYGIYQAENILKLFKLYIVIKSKNHIVYKVVYKILILYVPCF